MPSKEFLMEMASHEKRERERAGECAPGACAAHGHSGAHTCAHLWPGRLEAELGRVPGSCHPGEHEGDGDGGDERRGCEAALEGTRGKGLPRAACPQGSGRFRGTSWPRPQGTAPVRRRSALLIKGAGGEGAGLCEQRPGRAPPHLPAPLPREFVKQISLIAQAEEFVGEKSRGNSPPLGHPFPASPGAAGAERAGPPHDPRLCGRL